LVIPATNIQKRHLPARRCTTPAASIERRHLDFGARAHLGERLHVAERFRPNVARAGKPRFLAQRDRRAAKAEGDRVTFRPIGDLAGRDDRASILLARDPPPFPPPRAGEG
jgi:hypothetical protein